MNVMFPPLKISLVQAPETEKIKGKRLYVLKDRQWVRREFYDQIGEIFDKYGFLGVFEEMLLGFLQVYLETFFCCWLRKHHDCIFEPFQAVYSLSDSFRLLSQVA